MGLHHHLAVALFAVLTITTPAHAQWREWTNLATAVEDLTEAVRERAELTYQGTISNEVDLCVDGMQITTSVAARVYGIRLAELSGPVGDSPIYWTNSIRVTASSNLVAVGVQTDRVTRVVDGRSVTITNRYTNWATADFCVTTNADCSVTTQELASLIWTSAPVPYISRAYMDALDSTIREMATPGAAHWALWNPTSFVPGAVSSTGWLWTVNNRWEPWTYTYASPDVITHSQLCVRAGLPVLAYPIKITDRGPTYPRNITTYLPYGWQVGAVDIYTNDPPAEVVTVSPRYVTNWYTSGLWTYAGSNELQTTVIDGRGITASVGRVLATLSTARGRGGVFEEVYQARGLGAADGIYKFEGPETTWRLVGGSFWAEYYPGGIYGPAARYIFGQSPVHPEDYIEPTSNALWVASPLTDVSGPRGLAGCYYPVVSGRTNRPTMTTTGDVAPVAWWTYTQGDTEWGRKSIRLYPTNQPAYLWVAHNSTNDRWCATLPEPEPFPDPLLVTVVGTYWRDASATQGVVLATVTQSLEVAATGRAELAHPLTAVVSMTASNLTSGETEFYARDGIEVSVRLGDYTNALAMIGTAPWVSPAASWETQRTALEDRRRLLDGLDGLALIRYPTVTTGGLQVASSNIAEEAFYHLADHMPEDPKFDRYPYYSCGGAWPEPSEGVILCDDYAGVSVSLNCPPPLANWSNISATVTQTSWTVNDYCRYGSDEYDVASLDGTLDAWNRYRFAGQSESVRVVTNCGTVSDRAAVEAVYYSRSTPGDYYHSGGSLNLAVTYNEDLTIEPYSAEELPCQIDMVDNYDTRTNLVVRPTFYGVTNLMAYSVAGAVAVTGDQWLAVDRLPDWPTDRMAYTKTEDWSADYDETRECNTPYPYSQSMTWGHTFTETVRRDSYTVEGFLSVRPTYRYVP